MADAPGPGGTILGPGTCDVVEGLGFNVTDAGRLQLVAWGPLPRTVAETPILESADGGATWRMTAHWSNPGGTLWPLTLTCGPQNLRYLTSESGQTWHRLPF